MLVKFLVVLLTTNFIVSSAKNTTSQTRGEQRIYVMGGRPVEPREFPFLALLLTKDFLGRLMICGGSIPSSTTVLTSSECRGRTINIKAYAGLINYKQAEAGDSNVQVRRVVELRKPGDADMSNMMVLYINKPWVWTPFVAPVALHLSSESLGPSSVISCQVMGFGETDPKNKPGVAHVMSQLIGSTTVCKSLKPSIEDIEMHICSKDVGDKILCTGDRGGPAVCGGKQWGVNEFSVPLTAVDNTDDATACRPPKAGNVFYNVASQREWIRKNIKNLSSADSIHRFSVKVSLYEVLLHPPLLLLLLMTVELL